MGEVPVRSYKFGENVISFFFLSSEIFASHMVVTFCLFSDNFNVIYHTHILTGKLITADVVNKLFSFYAVRSYTQDLATGFYPESIPHSHSLDFKINFNIISPPTASLPSSPFPLIFSG